MMPPELDEKSALFLDLDGTLLEIAASPELVVVPPDLPELLATLHHLLEGALAVVTGRSLSVVDRLLTPYSASAAGEHGVLLRYEDGTLEEATAGVAVPEAWRASLAVATEWQPCGFGSSMTPGSHSVATARDARQASGTATPAVDSSSVPSS